MRFHAVSRHPLATPQPAWNKAFADFMARDKGLRSDLQRRHWIKAGTPLANADGNGLTFTLSAAGVAAWTLRYRHGARRRELSIGRYPDIGLADARGIATIKRAEIVQGRNPAADKQKAKATAAKDRTVHEVVKDYRAKEARQLGRQQAGQLRPGSRPMCCPHTHADVPRGRVATRTSARTPFERRSATGAMPFHPAGRG